MPRLNQFVALETGAKADATTALAQAKRILGADPAAFAGLARTYRPRADDGEKLPPESVKVQLNAEDILTAVSRPLVRLFDITLTKEVADTLARADVTVPGQDTPLLRDMPITYLLFLEKQVTRVREVVTALPLLNPADDWHPDEVSGVHRTPVATTTRSKKVPRNHIKWLPPDSSYTQPAQVELWHEDVIVGDWDTVKFSGAVTAERKRVLLERLDQLHQAVVVAREEANSRDVTSLSAGQVVFDWLLR